MGLFTQSIAEIENSDLFKLSPFKALSEDQARVVVDIVEGLFEDIDRGDASTIVIQGVAWNRQDHRRDLPDQAVVRHP